MPKDLKTLGEKRNELLLAEVAAWLHMIGKYQKGFILDNGSDLDRKLPGEVNNNTFPQLHDLFTESRTLPFGEGYTFLSLLERHRSGDEVEKGSQTFTYIEKLFMDAHGRGSGIDKGIFNNKGFKVQDGGDFYLSSPFGWERTIALHEIELKRLELYDYLQQRLVNIENKYDPNEWAKWRSEFSKRLAEEYAKTIADTRIPINDVSLWDQTASTVAFFKVLLAESLLGDKNINENPLAEEKQAKFRVLQVITAGMDYLTNSVRIADLLERKGVIAEGFDRIKNLLEVEYPLGCEIYRDIDRIAFLVPDIEGLLKIEDSRSHTSLDQLISEYFDEAVKGEIKVEIAFDSYKSGTRNVFYIGKELSKFAGDYSPTVKFLELCWRDTSRDKCNVCQNRPRGYMAESLEEDQGKIRAMMAVADKRKICGDCLKRLMKRSQNWAKGQKDKTIWMDEVADQNGRIALIATKFDLSQWQNGRMISTQRNINQITTNYIGLKSEFMKKSGGAPLGGINGLGAVLGKRWRQKTVGELERLMVSGEDLDEVELDKAEKLALAVWRKTPSFARIRRVWDTTHSFWNEISEGFNNTVGLRALRIKMEGKFHGNGDSTLADFNSYIAETPQGLRFTILYAGQGQIYLAENLLWLAKKIGAEAGKTPGYMEAAEYLRAQLEKVEYLDISEFEQMDHRIGKFDSLKCNYDTTPYLPAIKILSEPGQFMAIIPADRALEVSKAVLTKYRLEMGKVRNRLPNTIGLVFATSHTPLTAILDAGRRMLRVKTEEERWTVKDIQVEKTHCKLEFDNKQTWKIPTLMGDGTTEDIWYPYFYAKDQDDQDPVNRPTAFKGPGGWLVHVKELQPGDKVTVTPARFDFEFLDSAARRFEISYEKDGSNGLLRRRGAEKATRPYYLDDMERFEKLNEILTVQFSKSQIYQMLHLIETKRMEWDIDIHGDNNREIFAEFVGDVIRNAKWKKRNEDEIFQLIEAGISGQLRDVVELYFQILKANGEEE